MKEPEMAPWLRPAAPPRVHAKSAANASGRVRHGELGQNCGLVFPGLRLVGCDCHTPTYSLEQMDGLQAGCAAWLSWSQRSTG
jgi:hypothetical protein